MQVEGVVYLAWRDILAPLDNQFFQPSGDEQISLAVSLAEISFAKPTAGPECGSVRCVILVIAREYIVAAYE